MDATIGWTLVLLGCTAAAVGAVQWRQAKRRRWEEMKRAQGRSVRPIRGPNDHWGSE